jgi:hypothetical protein
MCFRWEARRTQKSNPSNFTSELLKAIDGVMDHSYNYAPAACDVNDTFRRSGTTDDYG